jgi:hypothetical protein
MRQYPALQILVLMSLSMIHQAFILTKLPFQKMRQNVITLINEVAVSLYLYFDILQTDYLESQNIDPMDIKVIISWAMSMLLILTITINILYALRNDMKIPIDILKRLCPSKTNNNDRVIAILPNKNQQF